MMLRTRQGIGLLVVVGVLSLLSLVGVSFAAMASRLRQHTAAHLDGMRVRLLSRSGLEYAAARLAENAAPDPRSQADDWTRRDGEETPLANGSNPSYAAGETYTDVTGDGRYGPGDVYADWNGNGRFDAWSGRLRGRYGIYGGTFALKIGSAAGKVDVNQGYVGMTDVNHDGRPDYNQLGARVLVVNAVNSFGQAEDPSNLLSWYEDNYGVTEPHRKVADLLNLVGKRIGTDDPRIGNTIILGRPLGGYRNLQSVAAALSPSDARKILPYVSVVPYETAWLEHSGHGWPTLPYRRSILNLEAASAILLQADFQGLGLYGTPAPYTISNQEAQAFADFLKGNPPFAKPSFQSRLDLFRKLSAARFLIFPGNPPVMMNYKVDEAFAAAVPENLFVNGDSALAIGVSAVPSSLYPPPHSWFSFDEPRAVFESGEQRMSRTPTIGALLKQTSDVSPAMSAASAPYYTRYRGLELSFDRPGGLFDIESEGRAETGRFGILRASAASILRLDKLAAATSQADFENERFPVPVYSTIKNTSGLYILDHNDWKTPSPGYGVRVDGEPSRDRIETWPGFAASRFYDQVTSDDPAKIKKWGFFPFQPWWGDLRLMDYSGFLYRNGLDPAHRRDEGEAFYSPAWGVWQPLRTGDPSDFLENLRDIAEGALCQGTPSTTLAPASLRGFFTWVNPIAQYNLNPGEFPLVDPPNSGKVPRGTVEVYPGESHDVLAGGVDYGTGGFNGLGVAITLAESALPASPMSQIYWTGGGGGLDKPRTRLLSARSYNLCDWQKVTFTFSDVNGVQGYVNGVPDPGLTGDYTPSAINPNWAREFFFNGDEARLFRGELPPGVILGRAANPRYWRPGLQPSGISDPGKLAQLATVPTFTSPLYVFPRAAAVTGAHWDGFVPKALADAARQAQAGGAPGASPLTVDLLLYSREDATDAPRIVRLPEELCATGGGSAGFPWKDPAAGAIYRNVRAYRFKIAMDASAIEAETGEILRETPVFDSISVHYNDGATMISYSQD